MRGEGEGEGEGWGEGEDEGDRVRVRGELLTLPEPRKRHILTTRPLRRTYSCPMGIRSCEMYERT